MPNEGANVPHRTETPHARRTRRSFFKGWIALSIAGFLTVLALSFVYSATGQGAALIAWATYGLVFALAIIAFFWLVSYVVHPKSR